MEPMPEIREYLPVPDIRAHLAGFFKAQDDAIAQEKQRKADLKAAQRRAEAAAKTQEILVSRVAHSLTRRAFTPKEVPVAKKDDVMVFQVFYRDEEAVRFFINTLVPQNYLAWFIPQAGQFPRDKGVRAIVVKDAVMWAENREMLQQRLFPLLRHWAFVSLPSVRNRN